MLQENQQPSDATEWPGYWRGKTPCWVTLSCSKYVYERCEAYLRPEIPCWGHEVTRCEEVLCIPRDCQHCSVYETNHYQKATDLAA